MDYETVAALTQSFALVLFFLLFIGVVIYALWPGNRKEFEKASRLPLEGDETTPVAAREQGERN